MAPVLLLAADAMQFTNDFPVGWTIVMGLAFVFFVPAILTVGWQAIRHGSRLGWVGMGLAFFGAMAGAAMQALFRSIAVLEQGGHAAAATALGNNMPVTLSTVFIGITFPIGLLVLALSLALCRGGFRWQALVLAVGAVGFPVGHAVGIEVISLVADAILVAAFWWLGMRTLREMRGIPPAT